MIKTNQSYFEYLCNLVCGDLMTHYMLLEIAHSIEFYEKIPNDDNRCKDGMAIREKYVSDTNNSKPVLPFVSILEVMIGISYRMMDYDWILGVDTPEECFWILINNLELTIFSDDYIESSGEISILETAFKDVVERSYSKNGEGGLFPLKTTDKDQRLVEIWYQMAEWVQQI